MSNNLLTLDTAKTTLTLTHFIKETFQKAGKTTAVIGVSGGLDSATSLLLTVKALSPNQIVPVYLPAKTTPPVNLVHVRLLLKKAEIPPENLQVIPISAIIQKARRIIRISSPSNRLIDRSVNKLLLGNLAVRIRMMLIFDQAKKRDALVIGTENLSEHLLGYYTRFGDEASDLEPLRRLYKTQVITLAKYLGVPQPIIDKTPSADLWQSQTDAQELGFTYTEADPVLYLHEQNKSKADIIKAGFPKILVDKIITRLDNTDFKHQVPYLP